MGCWSREEVGMRSWGARGGLYRWGDAVRRVPENGHGGDDLTPAGEVVGWPVRVGEDVAWPQLLGECAGGSGRCQVLGTAPSMADRGSGH